MTNKKYTNLRFPFKLREYGKAFFFGANTSIPKSLTKDKETGFDRTYGDYTTISVETWFINKDFLRFEQYIVHENEEEIVLPLEKVLKALNGWNIKEHVLSTEYTHPAKGDGTTRKVLTRLGIENIIPTLKIWQRDRKIHMAIDEDHMYIDIKKSFMDTLTEEE